MPPLIFLVRTVFSSGTAMPNARPAALPGLDGPVVLVRTVVGDADVVASNRGLKTVAILNEGWSQPPRTAVLGSGAHRLQIASINADGENDVVTATIDGLLTAYESYFGFPPYSAISKPVQFYLVRGDLADRQARRLVPPPHRGQPRSHRDRAAMLLVRRG